MFLDESKSYTTYRILNTPEATVIAEALSQLKPPPVMDAKDKIEGIVHSHALDRDFGMDDLIGEGWVSASHLISERKPADKLVKALMKQRINIICKEEGVSGVSRKRKKEIKEDVIDELMDTTPPTITCTPFLIDVDMGLLHIAATTDTALDRVSGFLATRMELASYPYFPLVPLASSGKQPQDFKPLILAEDSHSDNENTLVEDFLTTYMYLSENEGGQVYEDAYHQIILQMDGPITLAGDCCKSLSVTIKGGTPTISEEVIQALRTGKKVTSIKVFLATEGNNYSFVLDRGFCVKSLKLPDSEEFQRDPLRVEKFEHLRTLHTALDLLFTAYLKSHGKELQSNMQQWLEDC